MDYTLQARVYHQEPHSLSAYESIVRLLHRYEVEGMVLRGFADGELIVAVVAEDSTVAALTTGHWCGGEPYAIGEALREALFARFAELIGNRAEDL